MARCNCKYDKKQLDTKTAFKVVIKEKNTYFCDEICYNKYLADKAEKEKLQAEHDDVFELTKQIFGYDFQSRGLLRREVDAWAKISTMQKIIAYLKENQSWLTNVMSREFESDFHRVRYYSVIVSGKLHDFKPKETVVEVPKIVTEEHYETKYKAKMRRALEDFEEDDDE